MLPLSPAVLLIAFNRPEPTRQVFAAIRAARPERLFFACDGPRVGMVGEAERVAQVRLLLQEVDWPCQVSTRFLNHNIGCGHGPSTAIDWFLAEVDEGVILEDDCVPTPAFFRFAATMLSRYRDDPSVGVICGSKMAPQVSLGSTYGFSRIPSTWGWATWRRAWLGYEIQPLKVSPDEPWTKLLHRKTVRNLSIAVAGGLHRDDIHAWDYQFMLQMLRRGMLTVIPDDNLVLNIGFDGLGTHFSGKRRPWWVPRAAFNVDEVWPCRLDIRPSLEYDRYFQAVAHSGCSKFYRVYIKISRLVRRLFLPGEA